mgnify:CR=1 FL=1
MNNTRHKVYFTDDTNTSQGLEFTDIVKALAFTQMIRNNGARFVTMASENAEQVGKMGVDSIVDGVLPDGQEYVYMKRRKE